MIPNNSGNILIKTVTCTVIKYIRTLLKNHEPHLYRLCFEERRV